MVRLRIATALPIALIPGLAGAEVIRFEARSTSVVSGGRSFGSVGPYEEVTGRLFFAVDPAEPANKLVVDLDTAPKNASGRVEFSAAVVIYRPRDAARGNGIALIDVVNSMCRTARVPFESTRRRQPAFAGWSMRCSHKGGIFSPTMVLASSAVPKTTGRH
jgi:hypothetical protein